MRMKALLAVLCSAGLLAGLAGCDAAPGPASADTEIPEVSALAYAPQGVVLEEWPEDEVVDGFVRVPLTVSVAVEGPVDAVRYVVQAPWSGQDPLAEGTLTSAAGGRYEASTTVEIPVGAVGTYTVLVYPVRGDRIGNQVRGTLTFVAEGQPPVVEAVEAPDRIARPAAGAPAELVPIVVAASDPDGLSNLAQVELWNVAQPTFRISLYDDGRRGGDEVAGDGRYTITLSITSENTASTNTFAFQAVDRTGLASEVVEKQIVIE